MKQFIPNWSCILCLISNSHFYLQIFKEFYNIRISIMSQPLSTEHLISCFSNKDHYKSKQAYLIQIQRFNSQIYGMIDDAIIFSLLDKNNSAMTRLLALRFFKQILITANFSLIDALDERIQDHIVEVAQYNRKSKEINRGANYFSDTYKMKTDGQTQKISSSYVLLALEIISFMAKTYVKDEEGDGTRFVQMFRQLSGNGVNFPQKDFNFFKKEEEEKFKKNYEKWVQHYKSMKQGQAHPKEQTHLAKNKQSSKDPVIPKVQQIKTTSKQKNQEQYKKQLDQKQKLIQHLQEEIKQKDIIINKLSSNLKIKQSELQVLKEKPQQPKSKILLDSYECFNIIISPPHKVDDLIQQVDSLQQILQKTTKKFEQQMKQKELQLKKLKDENQQLKIRMIQKQSQITVFKAKQKDISMHVISNILQSKKIVKPAQNDSFVVIDQPKTGTKQYEQRQITKVQQQILFSRCKQLNREPSQTKKFLREQLCDISNNKESSQNGKIRASRSLKKTQSKQSLKVNQTYCNTGLFRKQSEIKLTKTAHNFWAKDVSNKVVTIYPFIPNYYPTLTSQYRNFKLHCLSLIKAEPFYQNQNITATLIRKQKSNFILRIKSKLTGENKIKVQTTNSCLTTQGDKTKKIYQGQQAEYQLILKTPDLNFRFPTVSISIGQQGISLTTNNQKANMIYLPITLLDAFQLNSNTRYNLSNSIQYCTEKFRISPYLNGIKHCFPNLNQQYSKGNEKLVGIVCQQGSKIRFQLEEVDHQILIRADIEGSYGEGIAKVLLQNLMWTLRD